MRARSMQVSLVFVAVALVAAIAYSSGNGRTDDPLGVAVSPRTLLLSQTQSGRVTVHTAIPYRSVVASSVALNGIPATATWADLRGDLVAGFGEATIKAIVEPPEAVLTLTGVTTAGQPFTGSDTVQVMP